MKKLFVLFALCSGCASGPSYNIRVNSYADQDYALVDKPKTFVLMSAKGDENSLQFKEFSTTAVEVLEYLGFVHVNNKSKAAETISLDYNVDNGVEVTSTSTIPVYNNKTTTIQNSYGQNLGYIQSGNPYAPSGYTQVSSTDTVFTRRIILSSKTNGIMNWQTEIRSSGNSSDLRALFPVIMNCAAKFIASDTGQELAYSVDKSVYIEMMRQRKQKREVAVVEDPNSFKSKLRKLFPR